MMSLRAVARSAPRATALTRASSTVVSSMMGRTQASARVAGSSLKSAFLRPQQLSAFSTSLLRRSPLSETDEELSAKLAGEIEFENELDDTASIPSNVKDYIENGPFELKDTAGAEEVVLTRTFGDEKITVTFSISDIHNFDQDAFDEDPALADEMEDGEGRKEGEDGEGFDGEDNEPPIRCRLNVVVEKPGKGALQVEAAAQDGVVVVENLYYYKDAALAHAGSPDAVHKAQDVYPGPPFNSLDEDLQVLMERYLEDRGISQPLALFALDYIGVKEQKEYGQWLKNLKGFIDA
ncbi:mitochondrial glycoprotein [Lasiosphaeria miniovina]|uniref:Mitochondrial glycoprotein n=1 Tax=Lasiosphaeria miniovina TaxID=1954250 RepID=A0AA40ABV3_9PEZI|nr:mitochondrial glycoprotein [Lasiosphaeria miniovina]KAK0713011.1 mitochondrial glycoprotein [Lasiosphaeria miniovina]